MSVSRLIIPALLLLIAAPAWAVAGAPAPRATDFALFAVGIIGVLIGRRGAKLSGRAD